MHYTTGWNGAASRDHLLGRAAGSSNKSSSAHVVIDRDGTAWQIAPFNRRAWHAGPSNHEGAGNVNGRSIGLEFVNPGWLRSDGHGGWVDSYNHRRTDDELDAFGGYIVEAHPRVGSGRFAWPLYTPAQIETGLAIVRAITERYTIRGVVSHEEIDTRGWKTDPGPAFSQQAFIDLLDEEVQDAQPMVYEVSATRLNVRGGPGTEFDTMEPPGQFERGARVTIVRRTGRWAYVEVLEDAPEIAGLRGWVSRDYLELSV